MAPLVDCWLHVPQPAVENSNILLFRNYAREKGHKGQKGLLWENNIVGYIFFIADLPLSLIIA